MPGFAITDPKFVEFLKSHRNGVLATSRRDGSPAQAPITYDFDGTNILFNSGEGTAKNKNMRRRPSVSVTVMDGRDVVVVYGTAEVVDDESRLAKLRERLPLPPGPVLDNNPEWGHQVAIILTPTSLGTARVDW
jgi:PPOX class probable F420-dependent enzyme